MYDIFDAILYTIFFILTIFLPKFIYKSYKYGKKYGWTKYKISDDFFYKENPRDMLIVTILGFICGIINMFLGFHDYIEYLSK